MTRDGGQPPPDPLPSVSSAPGSTLADSTASHALDAGRLHGTTARLAALTSYLLGFSVLWGAITTVVLPRLVEQAVPAAVKTSALALIAGLQALASILVQPAAGAASDRLATPWGRRRPLMVEQRDNVWLLVSRLAILMTTGTLQPFKRQGGPARRGCALPDATGDRNAAPARRLPHRPGQGLWSTVIRSFEVQPSAALSIVWSIQRADPFWSVTGKP